MKLVVGLGNPGKEYVNTRHNIGFNFLDYIAKVNNLEFKKEKYNGLYAEFFINDEKIILLKPLSYMNLSGGVVSSFKKYFNISLNDIIVIHDDLDMNLGRIKVVKNSSSGGHNGIKDIEKCLGTKDYVRVKIGISNDKNLDTKDYVLGKFNQKELEILNSDYEFLKDIINDFCSISIERIMSKYNRK